MPVDLSTGYPEELLIGEGQVHVAVTLQQLDGGKEERHSLHQTVGLSAVDDAVTQFVVGFLLQTAEMVHHQRAEFQYLH